MTMMKQLTRIFLLCVVSVVCRQFSEDEALEAALEAAASKDSPAFYDEKQSGPTVYDAYFGKPITTKRTNYLAGITNGTVLCTVIVDPCSRSEGRRVDGTCTNPKYPSRGARASPMPRLLPPMFGQGDSLRPAKDGSELPSARLIQTTLLGEGYFRNHDLSLLATHVHTFSITESADFYFMLRYMLASDCCIGNQPNRINPLCIAIPVPADDPYLRRTGVRCLNLTRMETYQDFGCLPRSLPIDRYSRVTPLLDLSVVYGNTKIRNDAIRLNEGGLLRFRMEGTREVPAGQSLFCVGNIPPEVVCYNFGDDYHANIVPGIFMVAMWFFREHNRVARRLSAMNPCWSDEKLFQTARQINIAEWQHIFYYELAGILLGYENALADRIIYDTDKHVNDFDARYEPGVFREYLVASRWFHGNQPGLTDLYRNGQFIGSRTSVDDIARSGFLPMNNTEADLTEGSLIQANEDTDLIIDPDLSQRYLGNRQTANALPATDITRGRDAGLPPYNHYRKLCGMKVAQDWEDFEDTISEDKVESLRRLYDSVDEVELMTAIYVENLLPKTYVGPTLYCIMKRNLLLWRRSDKFFFEHGGFPAALTGEQLQEVKKHSVARLLCDNGDGVREIQPLAMLRRRIWNAPVPCSEISQTNLKAWEDRTCKRKQK